MSIDIGRFGQLRELAEREGSKYIERPLHIGRLSAYLMPGNFAVDDIVIDGLHPGDRPFFQAKRITVHIEWANLLFGVNEEGVRTREIALEVRMTGWKIVMETFSGGQHNMPRIVHPSSGGPRPISTTLRFLDASDGAFVYDDHSVPWSIDAPNLHFDLVRAMNQYMGTASFSKGTVQIQHFLPMSAGLTTRFVIDGPVVDLKHIDLVTDGAQTHVTGQVDFSHWPEQRYNVNSELDFHRMRELFFASETWDLAGTGHFTGIFHIYNGGQELAGNFTSPQARVQNLEFSDLHGSLVWLPDRFEVTHADANFYGGRTRFTYAVEPLGRPEPPTQRFTTELDDVNLAPLVGLADLKGLQPVGLIRHAHARMAWPGGELSTGAQGRLEADVDPPEGTELATAVVPPSPPFTGSRLLDKTEFEPFKPLGRLPVGGHLAFNFDHAHLLIDDSWMATPTTYFAFRGQTAYGQESNVAFHAASLDWQASDRLLSAIMSAAGSSTGAVELGGRGTFDGTMTQTFGNPRIAGTFTGEGTEAFRVRWGRVTGHAVIHDHYIDVTDGVIGDKPDEAAIRTTGRFSLGFPRADHGEEVRARVAITNWPITDLRHAFDMESWPVDATIGSAEMDLNGPYTGLFGSGHLRLAGGVAWNEHFETAEGDLTLTGTGISIDRIVMAKGTGRITGAAVIKWADATYSFDARGEGIKVESLNNFKVPQAPLTGVLTFTADGAGAFAAPVYRFGATIKDLYAGDEYVGDVTGHVTVANNRMTFDQFNISSFRLQVTGSGQIALDDQYDAELTLRFLNTSIDPYLKFFRPEMSPYIRAVVSGTVRVSGPLADYQQLGVFVTDVEGTLSLFDYELKNDGPISFTFQDDTVTIGRFQLMGQDTNLRLSGGASIRDSTIALQAIGGANLAILQNPTMRGSGRATLNASVAGPISDPSISGYADIENGTFRHTSLPRSFTDINGRVTFDGNALHLGGLRARFGDGDVRFGGSVRLKSYMPDQLNVTATGTAMRVRFQGFSSTVNANLTLSGPVSAPLLAGRIDVLFASFVNQIDMDAGIAALAVGAAAGTAGGGEAAPLEPAGPAFPLSFNIQIHANRTLHIDNRRTATLVGSADLNYTGTLDRPSLTGHIDIDSGEIIISGNRYRILPSTIQFPNPNRLEPYFDITAETRARAGGETYNINVHLTGGLHGLNFNLTSEPSLMPVDILTLMFGGVPDVGRAEVRSLGNNQQAYGTLMQTAAAQFLLAPISTRVGSVFERTSGVDTVQFTTVLPTESSFTQLTPTTRVTIGKRLSPQLYMTYARDLNSSQYEVILLEFEQSDRISWILSRNEDRTFAIDIRVRHVF